MWVVLMTSNLFFQTAYSAMDDSLLLFTGFNDRSLEEKRNVDNSFHLTMGPTWHVEEPYTCSQNTQAPSIQHMNCCLHILPVFVSKPVSVVVLVTQEQSAQADPTGVHRVQDYRTN